MNITIIFLTVIFIFLIVITIIIMYIVIDVIIMKTSCMRLLALPSSCSFFSGSIEPFAFLIDFIIG